jgi:NAD(P) transhydrogenase subunit alpha
LTGPWHHAIRHTDRIHRAPVLINEDTVKAMKPGSVIVDMAVEQGGNCPLSELGKTVSKYGVQSSASPTWRP